MVVIGTLEVLDEAGSIASDLTILFTNLLASEMMMSAAALSPSSEFTCSMDPGVTLKLSIQASMCDCAGFWIRLCFGSVVFRARAAAVDFSASQFRF